MAADSILSLNLQESQWVIQISQLLHRSDFPTALNSPPFIFRLPDSVYSENPELYFPRRVALGPYHHFRPELYSMEFFKLLTAKKARDELQLTEFEQLADHLLRLDLRIRSCFDKYLEISGETLAWIMLVDGLFLLRLFFDFSTENQRFRNRLLPFKNLDDQKLFHSDDERLVAHYEILSDVVKLENQIPFLVFKEILPLDLSVKLPFFLYPFCIGISPFKLPPAFMLSDPDISLFPNFPQILDHSHHLLHFIYFTILIMPSDFSIQHYILKTSRRVTILQKLLSILSSVLKIAFLQQLKEAIDLIRSLFELLGMVKKECSAQEIPPVIPSASELRNAKVKFESTEQGILGARFHNDSARLVLPAITVNAFTEVSLRNLVAFEAMAKIKPTCFGEYVALMNGLIASSKDVRILREAGILVSHLGSDEEVVKLFNGVRISTSGLEELDLAKLAHFEEKVESSSCSEEAEMGIYEEIKEGYEKGLKGMVEDINGYYESCWRVKVARFVRKYVGSAMAIMAVLVIVFLVLFVIARLVCSFLPSCPKILKSSVAAADVVGLNYV